VSGPATASRHLGLDLGGTNIKWVIARRAGEAWEVVERGTVGTDAAAGPAAVVRRLARIGTEAVAGSAVSSVGIGLPGLYDPAAGTTRFLPNLPGEWNGVPVAAPVGQALAAPTHVVNDARAFGLAELRLGAARGVRSMIGLVIGTGVGGVFAIDGQVYQGRDGTGGELGHQTVDPDGPSCNCGNHGCLEAFTRADRIAAACGTDTADQAVERARSGDPVAVAGIAEVGRYLGIGIASMVTVLTPERVVLGGGVAAAIDLLMGPIHAEMRRRVRTTSLDGVEVVPAELGTWAGAIGAAVHGAERAAAAVGSAP